VEYEELSQGDDRNEEPAGLGALGRTAVAVVCVLAGVVFLVLRGPGEPDTDALPPEPEPSSSSQLALTADPGQRLVIVATCPPVTDGRLTLAVSFELQNGGDIDVTLVEVKPVLPLAGLRVRGPVTAGGTCEQPGSGAPGGLLAPGAKQLITMRFRLPKECPQAYPVQARVRLRANQMVGTTTARIHNDLGDVDFDTCPSAEPSPGA
jgi:hypothetical protein